MLRQGVRPKDVKLNMCLIFLFLFILSVLNESEAKAEFPDLSPRLTEQDVDLSNIDHATTDLDFTSSLNKVISRSTDISISELNVKVVRSRNIPSRLAFLPTLSLIGSVPLADNPFNSPQTFAISLQWNLFRWGADYFGLRAAHLNEDSQKFAVDSTVLSTEQDAVQVIITKIQRVKEVDIYSKIVKSQTELCKIAQERYKRGFLPLQEVQKVTVDLANSKASLADSRISEMQARARLENLLGQANIVIDWPWIDQFKAGRGSALINEEFQLAQRPDWQAAQKDVQSQTEKLSQNWRLLLPSLDTQISYGSYSGYFGTFAGWVGTISVTVPLFDQLKAYSTAKAQSYLKATSEMKMEKIQRDAKSQWQSSRVNFQTAMESVLAREQTLELSKKLYQDNLRRFQAGRITANDLTIDRTRMNSAELFAVQGWSAVHINFAELCHSLGYRVTTCISK